MPGTPFPSAVGRYRTHTVTSDGGIGGRVHVELESGDTIDAEACSPDAWDETDDVDWNERITITIDERDARTTLAPDTFEELRNWMIDTLADADALHAPAHPLRAHRAVPVTCGSVSWTR